MVAPCGWRLCLFVQWLLYEAKILGGAEATMSTHVQGVQIARWLSSALFCRAALRSKRHLGGAEASVSLLHAGFCQHRLFLEPPRMEGYMEEFGGTLQLRKCLHAAHTAHTCHHYLDLLHQPHYSALVNNVCTQRTQCYLLNRVLVASMNRALYGPFLHVAHCRRVSNIWNKNLSELTSCSWPQKHI